MPFVLPLIAAVTPELATGAAAAASVDVLGTEAIGIGSAAAVTAPAAVTATAAISVSSLATAATSIALSAAASYGISMLMSSKKLDSGSNQLTARQGLPARFVIYGRQKLAGTMFFYDSAPGTNPIGILHIGKILACHQIKAIEAHWLNEFQVGLSSPLSGSVTGAEAYGRGQWNSLVFVSTHLGAPGQVADTSMVTNWAGVTSGSPPVPVWPATCTLSGLAYAVAEYVPVSVTNQQFYSDYPNGPPEYKATVQGKLVYDPRLGQDINDPTTWTYSDNAALIIANYLIDPDGWGLDSSVIDISNLQTQADICDQIVPTPTGAFITTEPRWRIWGKYDLTETRKTVLNDLLASCAGRLIIQSDGTIGIFVGQYIPPTVTLTDDDIISLEQFTDGPEALERVDIVKPRIMYEAANWQDYDVPPWIPTLANEFSSPQTTNSLDLTLRFCPSPYQAQRVAKKIADEKNAGWRGSVRCKLTGLKAFGQWTIQINLSELPILSGYVFEVLSVSLDSSNMTVVVSVRQMSPDVWSWDASQGTAVLAIPPSVVSTFPQGVPTGVSALANPSHSITLSWTNSTGTATTQVQYRPAAVPTDPNGWIEDDPPFGPATSLTTPVLTGGANYDLRVRDINATGVGSAWVAVYAVTA